MTSSEKPFRAQPFCTLGGTECKGSNKSHFSECVMVFMQADVLRERADNEKEMDFQAKDNAYWINLHLKEKNEALARAEASEKALSVWEQEGSGAEALSMKLEKAEVRAALLEQQVAASKLAVKELLPKMQEIHGEYCGRYGDSARGTLKVQEVMKELNALAGEKTK